MIQNYNSNPFYEEATLEFRSLALVGVNLALDLVDEYLMRTILSYDGPSLTGLGGLSRGTEN